MGSQGDRVQAPQFLEQKTTRCTHVAKKVPRHLRGEAPAHTQRDTLRAILGYLPPSQQWTSVQQSIHGSTLLAVV